MAEIRIDLEARPSTEQAAFVEAAIRNSFSASAFEWGDDGVTVTNQEPDATEA